MTYWSDKTATTVEWIQIRSWRVELELCKHRRPS